MLNVSLLKAIAIIMVIDFKEEFSDTFFSTKAASSRVANTTKDRIITFLLCYRLCTTFGLEFMYNFVPYLKLQGKVRKQLGFKENRANCTPTPTPQTLDFSFIAEGISSQTRDLVLLGAALK